MSIKTECNQQALEGTQPHFAQQWYLHTTTTSYTRVHLKHLHFYLLALQKAFLLVK